MMKVEIKSNIEKKISEAVRLYDAHTIRHLNRVANHFRNQIDKSMVSTQKQSKSVKSSVSNDRHFPSKEGFPPAIDSGTLRNSIKIRPATSMGGQTKTSAFVMTRVKYAKFLEGSLNRPFMSENSIAFKNTKQYAEKIARDISIRSRI
tara:strand:- start:1141 stop:1584 length:444 start_codon:yes stop_codon:yes gene_type:complete